MCKFWNTFLKFSEGYMVCSCRSGLGIFLFHKVLIENSWYLGIKNPSYWDYFLDIPTLSLSAFFSQVLNKVTLPFLLFPIFISSFLWSPLEDFLTLIIQSFSWYPILVPYFSITRSVFHGYSAFNYVITNVFYAFLSCLMPVSISPPFLTLKC